MQKKKEQQLKQLKGLIVLYFYEHDEFIRSVEGSEKFFEHFTKSKEYREQIEELIKNN